MGILEAQNILLIKDYPYEDSGTPSNKLIIIISINDEDSLILQAKTTSSQKCPDEYKIHGCTNNHDKMISHYCFKPDRVIGKNVKKQ